jgi:hypothetical protein
VLDLLEGGVSQFVIGERFAQEMKAFRQSHAAHATLAGAWVYKEEAPRAGMV